MYTRNDIDKKHHYCKHPQANVTLMHFLLKITLIGDKSKIKIENKQIICNSQL